MKEAGTLTWEAVMPTNNQQVRKQGLGEPSGVIELDLFGTPMKLVAWQTIRLRARVNRKRGRQTLVLDFGNTFGVPWAVAIPVDSTRKKSPKNVSFGLGFAAALLAFGICSGYALNAFRIALV